MQRKSSKTCRVFGGRKAEIRYTSEMLLTGKSGNNPLLRDWDWGLAQLLVIVNRISEAGYRCNNILRDEYFIPAAQS